VPSYCECLCGGGQGASEIVLKRCVTLMDGKGNPIPMTDALASQLGADVTEMASRGYRTLALAFRDFTTEASSDSSQFEFPPEEQLTLQCIVGIKACFLALYALANGICSVVKYCKSISCRFRASLCNLVVNSKYCAACKLLPLRMCLLIVRRLL
jgi:hypothetical protein